MAGPTLPFHPGLISRHAWREARRENIPVEMIGATYDDPDEARRSQHDELRQIRLRWFGDHGIEVVVDTLDGRVVTVWRRGGRR